MTLQGVTWEDNPDRAEVALEPWRAGRPLWLEVGFGGGEHLVHMAQKHPEVALIGAEPFVNGVAMLLGKIRGAGVENLRLHPGDVRDLFDVLPVASVKKVFLNYPDPWPKARHHRRRFVTPEYLGALARVTAPGAEFRVATDIPDYVRQTLEEVPVGRFRVGGRGRRALGGLALDPLRAEGAARGAGAALPDLPPRRLDPACRLRYHPPREIEEWQMSGDGPAQPMKATKSGPLSGTAEVPGDKSISHRALIFGALATGETRISGLLEGQDVLDTAKAMRAFGATVDQQGPGNWTVRGVGVGGFREPEDVIDCGNSGTGVRLIVGHHGDHADHRHLHRRRQPEEAADGAGDRPAGTVRHAAPMAGRVGGCR